MPTKVQISIDDILDGLDELGPHLDDELSRALAAGAIGVADQAKLVHDYIDRTGLLTQSIQPGPVTGSFSQGNLQVSITAGGLGGVNYAQYIEEGTHTIRARYFLRDAIEARTADMMRRLNHAVDRAISKANL